MKNDNKVGRPTKMTEDTVSKLEHAFSIGADVSAACLYADITRDTYYRYIKDNKQLSDRFEQLREKPVLKAYQTIAKDLDKTETAKWFLERKRKHEFSTRVENDLTSNDKELSALTDERKQEVDELIDSNKL